MICFGHSGAELLRLFWTVPRLIVGLLIDPCVQFVLLLKVNNMLVCVNYVSICLLDILTRIGMKMTYCISYARGHHRTVGVSA